MKLEFSRRIFEKYSNIKFHDNPSRGCRAVACDRTDRQTDITKLTVALRNFAKAPKNQREIFELAMYLASFLALPPSLAVDLVASSNGTLSSAD